MFCRYRRGKYVLSFLNLKTTFGVIVSKFENNFCLIVSEFENNFWRENCREQYDFTKSLEIFP